MFTFLGFKMNIYIFGFQFNFKIERVDVVPLRFSLIPFEYLL